MLSLRTLTYLIYVPVIICKIKNWPTYLKNYLTKSKGGRYQFRNGLVFGDHEGSLTGTIAVVFIRKHYGSMKNMKVIVDIGANLGVFAVYAACHSKDAVIFAYEPVKANYDLLVENIHANNLQDQITAFNLGIASDRETRSIFISTSTLHSMHESENTQSRISIDCISLNDVLTDNHLDHIDLLKLNCEGAEYEILYSTQRETFNQIREIRLEYHNEDSNRNNGRALRQYLESVGYHTVKHHANSEEDGFLWMERMQTFAEAKP